MNDPEQSMAFSIHNNDGLPGDTWTDDGFRADEEHPTVDSARAFTSLGFIGAALKRSVWLLCAAAAFGLLIGYGLYVKFPPAYQATTSVLVTNDPGEDAAVQVQNNQALAQSQAVAGRVVQQLGLRQSIGSLIAAYTVTTASDQVLVFTVGAPSSTEAVRRASALATAFLQFRANYLQNQEQLLSATLDQQVNQAQQRLNSINRQITQISTQPNSSSQQAELDRLRTQRSNATNALTGAQQYAISTRAITRTNTATMVKGSEVLNASTPIPHSFKKGKAFYLAAAIFAGLIIGMAIVIVRALVSDRLRYRDDIADAIGAPIKLSLGPLTGKSWLPGLGRRAGRRAYDMKRLVTHLNAAVPRGSRRPKCLAVVAVDNAEVVAQAVVTLALSGASQGKQVVVADLSEHSYAARRLGVRSPGVCAVSTDGADLIVVVPEHDDIAPVGPRPTSSESEPTHVSQELTVACASADFLLTLATLDPASGGEHLSTWAADAIAVVTAGRSSSTRIHAVGEMIRLAGMRLVSVVLIGADSTDETLGVVITQDQPASALLL